MHTLEEARKIAADYAGVVRSAFPVDKVVLFGSYVNGTPDEWSDIDVGVIMNGYHGDWLTTMSKLMRIRRDIDTDIEPHLLDETNDGTGFCEHVLKPAKLYIKNLLKGNFK
jgi:predicted nucleotidyltransferase